MKPIRVADSMLWEGRMSDPKTRERGALEHNAERDSEVRGSSRYSGSRSFYMTAGETEASKSFRSQGTCISLIRSVEQHQINMAQITGAGRAQIARRIRSIFSRDYDGSHSISSRYVKKRMTGHASVCWVMASETGRSIAIHEPLLANALSNIFLKRGASCCSLEKYAVLSAEMVAERKTQQFREEKLFRVRGREAIRER